MQSQTQSLGALTGKACALGGPLHRQRGSERGRIEWVNGRKIQGGQARYFLFGKGVACSLALPASCGWQAVLNCYVFLCYLYFFHPHAKLPLVLRFLPSSSLLLWPSDFVGTWLLIYWGFQASQSLSILNPAISACNIRVHKNNPPYGCLNWNHFYFHFGSATLPYKHTLACAQGLEPQTLVFSCLPPLNVLVRTLSFPFLLFFGFPEISAPATSDFHLSPPPSSCFFFLIHPPPSPMHVSAPLSFCLLQLACPLPWSSSGIHCFCWICFQYPCSQLVQHGSSQQGLPSHLQSLLGFLITSISPSPQFSWNLVTCFLPQSTFSIDDFCSTFYICSSLKCRLPKVLL